MNTKQHSRNWPVEQAAYVLAGGREIYRKLRPVERAQIRATARACRLILGDALDVSPVASAMAGPDIPVSPPHAATTSPRPDPVTIPAYVDPSEAFAP